ncbi:hypothetical protein LEP1GSC043_4662 [Leptospira weilii str. Ecochallenge]|uniref:Uncharacterized protein n=1 Tax=Leptospira weilii str. Ecochallenge TaxID=1049986 RepID=N1UBE6_9LEPT|nr:hypothetical protein LEP1GSC043_4662 [Leptospira weilii str. Ecochallenge]
MKHFIFIILFLLLFFTDCSVRRSSKKDLPKPLGAVLQEVSTELKKQINVNRQAYFPEKKAR